MERNAGPSDALHIGHRGAAIDIRFVPFSLGNYGKYAGWRGMRRHSGRNRRTCDKAASAIEGNLLASDRYYDLERAVRLLLALSLYFGVVG